MARAMIPRSPLDDPDTAAHAWARFRRIMGWMAGVALALVLGAFVLIYLRNGFVSIHLYIAAALGIGLTMLLAAALMGLVFLSNGTGHDASLAERPGDREER